MTGLFNLKPVYLLYRVQKDTGVKNTIPATEVRHCTVSWHLYACHDIAQACAERVCASTLLGRCDLDIHSAIWLQAIDERLGRFVAATVARLGHRHRLALTH